MLVTDPDDAISVTCDVPFIRYVLDPVSHSSAVMHIARINRCRSKEIGDVVEGRCCLRPTKDIDAEFIAVANIEQFELILKLKMCP